MEEPLKKIVESIFSNWTGLKMAVEHSFGGPGSKMFARQFVDDIVYYLINDVQAEVSDICDELNDTMDEVFNTVLEDNSIEQIGEVLYKFTKLLREGNTVQCEADFNQLPPLQTWLLEPQIAQRNSNNAVASSDSSDNDEDMDQEEEEDPGWTTVKSKGRRK